MPLLTQSGVGQDHRLFAVKLCHKIADGDFDGVQFQLGTAKQETFENKVTLYSHGNTNKRDPDLECSYLRLDPQDYIEEITVQYLTDPETSGVQSLSIKTAKGYQIRSGKEKTDEYLSATVQFQEDNQLVGVFGLESPANENLHSLGFITFEVTCDLENPIRPPSEEMNNDKTGTTIGLLTYVILYVLLGIVLIVLIILICMLHRKNLK